MVRDCIGCAEVAITVDAGEFLELSIRRQGELSPSNEADAFGII